MTAAVGGHAPRQVPEPAADTSVDVIDCIDCIDCVDLPVDPLAQAWEQILAAVLAEGPPEPVEGPPGESFDLPGRPASDPGAVLRVAGAPEPAGTTK